MRLFILTAFSLFLLGCESYDPQLKKVILFGHGGMGFDLINGKHAPNSVASIQEALDFYELDGVEVDVRFTKDGDAIVYHDAYLETATQCKGRITGLRIEQTLGCKYRKQFFNEYKEEVISLDSFANLVNSKYPNRYVSLNIQGPFDLPFILDSVAGIFHEKLKHFPFKDKLTVECSDANFLYYLKQRNSTHKCLLIAQIDSGGVKDVLGFELDGIVAKFEIRNDGLEKQLKDEGKMILLYGHKIPSNFKGYDYTYIDGVQVDNPISALKYFRNK